MKKNKLKQLIREEIIFILNEEQLNEGWKENLLFIGAMALSSIGGLKAQSFNKDFQNKPEISQQLQTSYSAIIGYLANMPSKTIEEKAAIKEARIYFENLRDGVQTKKLSPSAEIVVNYAIKETKKLDGKQLFDLSQEGENIHTKL